MTTMNHQYLARIFYSDETINEVMANNKIIETDEITNVSLIDRKKNTNYIDRYDEQILKKDKDNDLYKVINIDGSGYRGYLVAIYDPSKVKLVTTNYPKEKGETLTEYSKRYNAKVAINASGFHDQNGISDGRTPTGSVISNGKVIHSEKQRELFGGIIGFDYDNNLILTKEDINTALINHNLRDAVEFGPFLIVNGKPSFIKGDGGWGIAPRTAIGQRSDGIVLFLIIDGRRIGYSLGADMVELTRIMQNYKAINASNLDGGASTTLTVEQKVKNKPGAGLTIKVSERPLPNAWIVTE